MDNIILLDDRKNTELLYLFVVIVPEFSNMENNQVENVQSGKK